jgi:hypothetical protein
MSAINRNCYDTQYDTPKADRTHKEAIGGVGVRWSSNGRLCRMFVVVSRHDQFRTIENTQEFLRHVTT